jgi:hypothetical protein
MASQGGQGTGKHSHKSTSEPYPHTKDGGGREGEHRESRSDSGQHGGGRSESHGRQAGGGEKSGGSGSEDLRAREYKDAQGNVHHHTKTYMEDHKK